jgi:hypothetical protein
MLEAWNNVCSDAIRFTLAARNVAVSSPAPAPAPTSKDGEAVRLASAVAMGTSV